MATPSTGETVEIATVGGKVLEEERREGEIVEGGGGGGGRDKLGSGVRGRDSPSTPTLPPPADEDDGGGRGGGGGRLLLCFTTSPPPPIRSSPEEAIQGVVVKVVVVVVKGNEIDLVENGELTDPPSSAMIWFEFPLKNISEVSAIKSLAPMGDDDDDDGSDSVGVDNEAKRDFDLGLAPLLRGGFNPPTSSPVNPSLKL